MSVVPFVFGMAGAGDFGAFLEGRGKAGKKEGFKNKAKALGVKVLAFWYKADGPMRDADNGIEGGHLALIQFGPEGPKYWLGMTEYSKCLNAAPKGSALYPPFEDTIRYHLAGDAEGMIIHPYAISASDLWAGILDKGFADKIASAIKRKDIGKGDIDGAKVEYEARQALWDAKVKAQGEAQGEGVKALPEGQEGQGKGKPKAKGKAQGEVIG